MESPVMRTAGRDVKRWSAVPTMTHASTMPRHSSVTSDSGAVSAPIGSLVPFAAPLAEISPFVRDRLPATRAVLELGRRLGAVGERPASRS